MSDLVKFTATKLSSLGKEGILKPDAEGAYTLIVGGLNVFNSAKEYYTLKGAEELFKSSSVFMRRVNNGCLKGELGHPVKEPGMTMDGFINRIGIIDPKNESCWFKEIWLDHNYGKEHPELGNPNLVAIVAKVVPSGPKGPYLQKALETPGQNVCFSIRALTRDYIYRGINHRVLDTIVCFDQVIEPGISIATKYSSPCLESLNETSINIKVLEKFLQVKDPLIATENSKKIIREVINSIKHNKDLPIYSKW